MDKWFYCFCRTYIIKPTHIGFGQRSMLKARKTMYFFGNVNSVLQHHMNGFAHGVVIHFV